jgi:hypothetical protein
MLSIICGEDTSASRNKFLQIIEDYKKKGYRTEEVNPSNIVETYKSASGTMDLFGNPSVYVTSKLSGKYAGRAKTELKDIVKEISTSTSFHLIDWEEGKSAYDLSTIKKIATVFYELKPEKNIFQFLESCYPGNLNEFIITLQTVHETSDAMFMYTLLWRHIRKLILATENALDSKTAPWQRGKLKEQAAKWDKKKLVNFYEGLIRIDMSLKTSASTFDIKDTLEILACHYLK